MSILSGFTGLFTLVLGFSGLQNARKKKVLEKCENWHDSVFFLIPKNWMIQIIPDCLLQPI